MALIDQQTSNIDLVTLLKSSPNLEVLVSGYLKTKINPAYFSALMLQKLKQFNFATGAS
jgi:hypothetical protein